MTDFDAFEHLILEFLNYLKTFVLPNHSIKLKISTTIILLRNLDQLEGLCNDTKLIFIRLANHVIKAKIILGKYIGNSFIS